MATTSMDGLALPRKAMDTYDELMKREGFDEDIHVYKGCCLFALCKYDEAKEECEKGRDSDLKVRPTQLTPPPEPLTFPPGPPALR